ncbi:MAG: group II intron reverse transcriptase/maturase [Gemmatimonadota bacterium]
MPETPSSVSVSTKLRRVAELARKQPGVALTTLAHHIDVEFLRAAFHATRKSGAPGIDDQTAAEYAKDLEGNLQSLLDRFKSGRYQAPPVRRVLIPKAGGKGTRPIGIPTFEDKVLQRAVAMVLEAVYEQDFRDCSYGFRPGRSAHQALEALWRAATAVGGGWVLDVDVRGFFDSLDHRHLREFLSRRVRDGVIRRAVDKWLKAGVLTEGRLERPEEGTPQGGVVSPMLANIYLHHVLDEWFENEVKPRMRARAILVRYADDFVIVFARKQDAERVLRVLPKRFGRFGLALHEGKTRLVGFERPDRRRERRPRTSGPGERDRMRHSPGVGSETFDFLGFTHHWAKSWKGGGRWVVRRRTARDRLSRSLREINRWIRGHRHLPLAVQQAALSRKLCGHYAYYGITGNVERLGDYHRAVVRLWRKWLARRSQRGRVLLRWERFQRLLARYPLPPPVVRHSVYRHAVSPLP